ncbi:MAG: hypothetical protein HFI38_04920 [Lachnospiraceae bacterium]|jgi:hypothetical protein|nr:hypothetical protein [Lachnospiraceae bacterium]
MRAKRNGRVKKALAICLALMMTAGMSVTALGAEEKAEGNGAGVKSEAGAQGSRAAAQGNQTGAGSQPEAPEKTYRVTFRPGRLGQFSEDVYEGYVAAYGEEQVKRSKATGSISVTVAAGAEHPAPPTAGQVELGENAGRYWVSGWKTDVAVGEPVEGDAEYVIAYAALKNGVEYTIRYVDAVSGAEVATPQITMGESGADITAYAKTVTGYRADAASKSMTLTGDAAGNVLTFLYTSTLAPTINQIVNPVDGGTVIRTETEENVVYVTPPEEVVTPPTPLGPGAIDIEDVVGPDTPLGPGGEETEPARETEEIVAPPTPLGPGSGEETQPGGDTEDVPDQDTPMGPGFLTEEDDSKSALSGMVLPVSIGGAAVAVGGIALVLLKRKKKDGKEETGGK